MGLNFIVLSICTLHKHKKTQETNQLAFLLHSQVSDLINPHCLNGHDITQNK